VFYDDTQTPEEEQRLLRAVDRANLNASDHRDASSVGAGASRIPHLSLAVQRLSPGDAFHSSKKGVGTARAQKPNSAEVRPLRMRSAVDSATAAA
ncbi:hypothetical protein HPB47_027569, partial [Ixodes persulcatus]